MNWLIEWEYLHYHNMQVILDLEEIFEEIFMQPEKVYVSWKDLEEFVGIVNEMYITNMERVRDDVAWFINKFDYKYQNEPWYNAKDSVIRSLVKTNGVILDD